jgi:hypothetical protein
MVQYVSRDRGWKCVRYVGDLHALYPLFVLRCDTRSQEIHSSREDLSMSDHAHSSDALLNYLMKPDAALVKGYRHSHLCLLQLNGDLALLSLSRFKRKRIFFWSRYSWGRCRCTGCCDQSCLVVRWLHLSFGSCSCKGL